MGLPTFDISENQIDEIERSLRRTRNVQALGGEVDLSDFTPEQADQIRDNPRLLRLLKIIGPVLLKILIGL